MKLFPVVLGALLALSSCKNQKNTETPTPPAETNATPVADVKGITSEADEKNRRIETLKKLTPLSLEELTALLPEEINGAKKSNYNASSTVGYSYAAADYKNTNNSTLQILFYDCAGEAGSTFFADSYLSYLNVQQENDAEYTRTVDFRGKPAIEHYIKARNQTMITFLEGDRVLVILNGKNMHPDAVKDVAKGLTIKI